MCQLQEIPLCDTSARGLLGKVQHKQLTQIAGELVNRTAQGRSGDPSRERERDSPPPLPPSLRPTPPFSPPRYPPTHTSLSTHGASPPPNPPTQPSHEPDFSTASQPPFRPNTPATHYAKPTSPLPDPQEEYTLNHIKAILDQMIQTHPLVQQIIRKQTEFENAICLIMKTRERFLHFLQQ